MLYNFLWVITANEVIAFTFPLHFTCDYVTAPANSRNSQTSAFELKNARTNGRCLEVK